MSINHQPHHPIGTTPADDDNRIDPLVVYRTPVGRHVLLVLNGGGEAGYRPILRSVGSSEVRVGFLNADGTEPTWLYAEYDWIDRGSLTPVWHLDDPENGYDTASSSSRGHYIETGCYLTHAEVAEFAVAVQA